MVAILYALSTNSLILVPSVILALYLVSGAAIATSSISLNPPEPCLFKLLEPVIKITGDLSPQASIIEGTAFANPSGPTRQTVGFLVILVCPSAICPAICSWGQFITSIWHSINPSSAGLQKPPDKVNTCLIPLSFKALAINDPPLIFFSDI